MTVTGGAGGSEAADRRRGKLTVYLGAAPGVGKTYAMIGEAQRRKERGTDVVVGFVETHGRPLTIRQLDGLEIIPRRSHEYRGTTFTEMDTDAIVARRPAVVLVDELAHTNVPGSPYAKRVEDVDEIRAAGIDVITTMNIQHLESLNDEVERITGVKQRETVPDDVVRTADQIQLVDMSPEALRRRMAHGNIYRPEQIDASLTSYFRVGNLTALRELALLWLADRVDDALEEYRRSHRIEDPWPTKERVVVAVTGGPESETLLRRGARLAQRAAGSELQAVHVIATDGLGRIDESRIDRIRRFTKSLGGSFHTVVGEDVPAAVVDFATAVNATMILVGVSRHGRMRRLFTGTTGDRIAAGAGAIDVNLVTHDQVSGQARQAVRRWSTVSRRRFLTGWLVALICPILITSVVGTVDQPSRLPLAILSFLALTVLAALVGGMLPALFAATAGFLLLNWYFTPPVGRLTIAEPANVWALVVFVAVAVAVASVVDHASRRSEEARRARAEAATLANLSQSVLTGMDTAQAIVSRLRETFAQIGVSLLRQEGGRWVVVAADGTAPATEPDAADTQVAVDERHVLAMRGAPLRASDQRLLEVFAGQTGLVLEYRRLRERDAQARMLERAEETSTAILQAVSHDLRTPLATMRAAVDGLLSGLAGTELDPADRRDLLSAVDTSTEQLERLIDNLLDLSRIQAGVLHPRIEVHSLEEVLPLATSGHPPGTVTLELMESTPLVRTDAGLLERVVANVVSNAVRHGAGHPVRVLVQVAPREIAILVIDRGPGVSDDLKVSMFEPFQRLGDSSGTGLGLGLAVAQGLAQAIGASLTAEDTPGGGLTMVLAVPRESEDAAALGGTGR